MPIPLGIMCDRCTRKSEIGPDLKGFSDQAEREALLSPTRVGGGDGQGEWLLALAEKHWGFILWLDIGTAHGMRVWAKCNMGNMRTRKRRGSVLVTQGRGQKPTEHSALPRKFLYSGTTQVPVFLDYSLLWRPSIPEMENEGKYWQGRINYHFLQVQLSMQN